MSSDKKTLEDVRNLIVCDTQFGWTGSTTLRLQQMLALQERGWLAEGAENNEFDLTDAGREVVARALQAAVQPTLADVQPGGRVRLGDGLRSELLDQAERLERMAAQDRETGESIEQALEAGEEYTPDDAPDVAAGLQHDANRSEEIAALLRKAAAALSAQPSPGGQGDVLDLDRVLSLADVHAEESREDGVRLLDRGGLLAFAQDVAAALAARQPVGALPQGCDACDQTGIRQNDEGRNICCPDCDLGSACAGDTRQPVGRSFQAGVAEWMGRCFLPSLYSNMTERGDRLLEEVLELLQAHGYDSARVPTLVDYVFGRPVGEPAQEVGGVMVTLAGYCWVAGLDMHAAGDAELARISQPEVMAKIRAKQEAKNALHFDTPLPGNAAAPALAQAVDQDLQQDAARWRATAPHLSVEWDEDEMLKRWTWIDFKGDALSVPTRTRESYASVDEAMDAVIDSEAVGNG